MRAKMRRQTDHPRSHLCLRPSTGLSDGEILAERMMQIANRTRTLAPTASWPWMRQCCLTTHWSAVPGHRETGLERCSRLPSSERCDSGQEESNGPTHGIGSSDPSPESVLEGSTPCARWGSQLSTRRGVHIP